MTKFLTKIKGQNLSTSSNGNLQVVLELEPVGEYADDGVAYEVKEDMKGKHWRTWLTVTPNTAERRVAELKHLAGLVGKSPLGFDDFDAALAGDRFINLVDQEVDATMKVETYNGKTAEKWELAIATAGGGGRTSEPVAPQFIKQANAQWGHLFKGNGSVPF